MRLQIAHGAVSQRGQSFGIGITVGMVVGFAVGSLLTLRLGEDVITLIREAIARLAGRRDRVNFELLLQ